MEKAVGVGEHPDVLDAIEKELKIIAEYHDKVEGLETDMRRQGWKHLTR